MSDDPRKSNEAHMNARLVAGLALVAPADSGYVNPGWNKMSDGIMACTRKHVVTAHEGTVGMNQAAIDPYMVGRDPKDDAPAYTSEAAHIVEDLADIVVTVTNNEDYRKGLKLVDELPTTKKVFLGQVIKKLQEIRNSIDG